jgi:mRNA interferase MazF
MKQTGQIILFWFPQTDVEEGKLRPAFLLGKLPGNFDDWLICMISSQTRHYIPQFDDLIQEHDSDLAQSGLKAASVIRIGRLAVVQGRVRLEATGQISPEKLQRIKHHLAEWIARF